MNEKNLELVVQTLFQAFKKKTWTCISLWVYYAALYYFPILISTT